MAPEYLFSKASLLLVNICFCVADPEPPFFRRLRSRYHFFVRSEPRAGAALLRRLRLHLLGKQKKFSSCITHEFSSVNKYILNLRKRILIM